MCQPLLNLKGVVPIDGPGIAQRAHCGNLWLQLGCAEEHGWLERPESIEGQALTGRGMDQGGIYDAAQL